MNSYLRSCLCLMVLCAAQLAAIGCSCDSGPPADYVPCGDIYCPAEDLCCLTPVQCVAYDPADVVCPGLGLSCSLPNSGAIGVDENCEPTCTCPPPLQPGQLATHLSTATLSDGTMIFAGYSPGAGSNVRYGDLVFASYPAADMETANFEISQDDWEILDGNPGTPVAADPSGWRGGVTAAGDDVGQYNSLAVNATDDVYLAYHDATNQSLKLGIRTASTGIWAFQTVPTDTDPNVVHSGRWTSIALLDSGFPAIAYQAVIAPDTTGGPVRPTTSVQVISAQDATGTAWNTPVVVHSTQSACRPGYCAGADVCYSTGECAAPTATPPQSCSTDPITMVETCVDATVLTAGYVEPTGLPPSDGLFNNLRARSGGLVLAFYDRADGSVYGATSSAANGTAFNTAFLIDGNGGAVGDDVGDSVSMIFDGATNNWHLTYVDGFAEELLYARCNGTGATPTCAVAGNLIDDGTFGITDGTRNEGIDDGLAHIVGSDASLVLSGTQLRVAYQDTTANEAVMATSDDNGASWTVTILDTGFGAGYYTSQVLFGTESFTATLFRDQQTPASGTRVLVGTVAPVAP